MAFRDMELYDPEGPVPDPLGPPADERRRSRPLVAVLGVVLVLVAGVTWRVHSTWHHATPMAAVPTAASPALASSSAPTRPTAGATSSTPQASAVAFVSVWAHPERAIQQWQAAVRPYATPSFATRLLSVDPANVPATKVTGPAGPVKITGQSASVDVPTDAGKVTVTLQQVGQTWRVSGITPTWASEED